MWIHGARSPSLVLDRPLSTTSNIKRAECDLWNSLVDP